MKIKPAPIPAPHRYLLVHQKLPVYVFRMPAGALFLLTPGERRPEFLSKKLETRGSNELRPIPCPFPAADIGCTEIEIAGRACLILTMPPTGDDVFRRVLCPNPCKQKLNSRRGFIKHPESGV